MAVEILGFSLSLTWVLVIAAIVLFFLYDAWCHTYWARHGLKSASTAPIFGNMHQWRKGVHVAFQEYQKALGRVYGIYDFRRPALVVSDLDMLRDITVKDFAHFYNRRRFPLMSKPIDKAVSVLEDEHWKDVRNVLTPAFSAAKMKHMSGLVNDSASRLVESIGERQERDNCFECRDLYGSFVMDTIASCAFGLKVDSQHNPKDPFVSNAKKAFQFSFFNPFIVLVSIIPSLAPVFEYFNVGLINQGITDFFSDVVSKAVAVRKGSNHEINGKKVDFLQLIINTQRKIANNEKEQEKEQEDDIHADLDRHHDVDFHNRNSKKKIELTDDEILAQAMIFFLAGYETTNTLLSFCSYLLATNPEDQEKLIAEVDEISPSSDSVGYSSVAKMPYLDQVFCESLRIFPPAAISDRMCNETVTIKDVTITKGTQVFIPIYSIHHDPEVWPEPEKFKPERFTKENRETHHPFAWLPFGGGPRNCIGMRFALMEAKIAMVRSLQKYRLETCPKTEIPPKLGKTGFLSPPNGVTLRAIPRS